MESEDNKCVVCGLILDVNTVIVKERGLLKFVESSIVREDGKEDCFKYRNEIKLHKTCRNTYNNPKCIEAEKKRKKKESEKVSESIDSNFDFQNMCLFCDKDASFEFERQQSKNPSSSRILVGHVKRSDTQDAILKACTTHDDDWSKEMPAEDNQAMETPLSEQDMMKKKEDEHLRLQRQFRMIQRDRTNRTVGVHPQFRRQDQLLRRLREEYRDMDEDMKIATTGAHKKNDKRMKNRLKRSLLLRTKTEQECEERLNLIQQLEGLLQRNHSSLLELQSRVNTSMGELKERALQGEVRLVATENKLEAANRRFNAVQYENTKIREEIEHMLKDRAIFNKSWSKMMTALGKGKKFLTDLYESSAVAYDQRDEWCTKLRAMTEKGLTEQTLQVQEMRDLQKAFDHETKTYKFLAAKGVIRVNPKEEERQEEEARRKEEEWQEELDHHTNLLKEIEKYTQESSATKMIEAFEKTEQENFSMYRLLTNFCAENISLSRELARIHQQIADRKDFNESIEVRQKDKLDDLKQKLEEAKSRTELLRNKDRQKTEILQTKMDQIGGIFRYLDLSLEPFQNLLGDKQPSLNHMGLTMCLINDKVKELVETAYYLERVVIKKDQKSKSRLKRYTVQHPELQELIPNPISVLVPADPCPACTEARWFSRISETLEKPFSRSDAILAIRELAAEPAYERSDRVHQLQDCRLPASRLVLAKRYL